MLTYPSPENYLSRDNFSAEMCEALESKVLPIDFYLDTALFQRCITFTVDKSLQSKILKKADLSRDWPFFV